MILSVWVDQMDESNCQSSDTAPNCFVTHWMRVEYLNILHSELNGKSGKIISMGIGGELYESVGVEAPILLSYTHKT